MAEVSFFFVIDGRGLEAKALLLAATLHRQFGRRGDVEVIGYVSSVSKAGMPAAVAGLLERAGVVLRPLPSADGLWRRPYPHGNKVIAAAQDRDSRISVFLDTDTICMGGMPAVFALPEDRVGVVPEGVPSWGREPGRWERAYAHFGLPLPEDRVRLTRRKRISFVPYFNAGMVAFASQRPGGHFGQRWLETAREFDAGCSIGGKRPWLDQITMPIAMRLHGFGYEVLPDAYNYSISTRADDPAEGAELIHYHRNSYLLASPHYAPARALLDDLLTPEDAGPVADFLAEAGLAPQAPGGV